MTNHDIHPAPVLHGFTDPARIEAIRLTGLDMWPVRADDGAAALSGGCDDFHEQGVYFVEG